MLLQVGRTDLRLISPHTKQVLLHKSFREISHVARGQEEQVHFGFICKWVIFNKLSNIICICFLLQGRRAADQQWQWSDKSVHGLHLHV